MTASLQRGLELAVAIYTPAGSEVLLLGVLLAADLDDVSVPNAAARICNDAGVSAQQLQGACGVSPARLVRAGRACSGSASRFGLHWGASIPCGGGAGGGGDGRGNVLAPPPGNMQGPVEGTHFLYPGVVCGRSAGLMDIADLEDLVATGVDTFVCLQVRCTLEERENGGGTFEFTSCASRRAFEVHALRIWPHLAACRPRTASTAAPTTPRRYGHTMQEERRQSRDHRGSSDSCTAPFPTLGCLRTQACRRSLQDCNKSLRKGTCSTCTAWVSFIDLPRAWVVWTWLTILLMSSLEKKCATKLNLSVLLQCAILGLSSPGGHGRTGTVLANLVMAHEGCGFAAAMDALQRAHRGRGCRGHCSLNAGELEDRSQTAQAGKMQGVMKRQHKINAHK